MRPTFANRLRAGGMMLLVPLTFAGSWSLALWLAPELPDLVGYAVHQPLVALAAFAACFAAGVAFPGGGEPPPVDPQLAEDAARLAERVAAKQGWQRRQEAEVRRWEAEQAQHAAAEAENARRREEAATAARQQAEAEERRRHETAQQDAERAARERRTKEARRRTEAAAGENDSARLRDSAARKKQWQAQERARQEHERAEQQRTREEFVRRVDDLLIPSDVAHALRLFGLSVGDLNRQVLNARYKAAVKALKMSEHEAGSVPWKAAEQKLRELNVARDRLKRRLEVGS